MQYQVCGTRCRVRSADSLLLCLSPLQSLSCSHSLGCNPPHAAGLIFTYPYYMPQPNARTCRKEYLSMYFFFYEKRNTGVVHQILRTTPLRLSLRTTYMSVFVPREHTRTHTHIPITPLPFLVGQRSRGLSRQPRPLVGKTYSSRRMDIDCAYPDGLVYGRQTVNTSSVSTFCTEYGLYAQVKRY